MLSLLLSALLIKGKAKTASSVITITTNAITRIRLRSAIFFSRSHSFSTSSWASVKFIFISFQTLQTYHLLQFLEDGLCSNNFLLPLFVHINIDGIHYMIGEFASSLFINDNFGNSKVMKISKIFVFC